MVIDPPLSECPGVPLGYRVREVLITDGEELEATPAIIRMFRAGTKWSRSRLAKECNAVAEQWRSGGLTAMTLKSFEEGGPPLVGDALAALEYVLRRNCWVAVVRGECGVFLKVAASHD